MERKRKKSKCNGNSNSQYGDLSTAAAKCAAFGRDDRDLGEVGESTAKATADSLREWEKRNKFDGKGRSGFPLGMEKKSNDKGRSWCDMDGNAWNCPASNNKSGLECLPSNIMAAESV